ncbi:MAG: pentapeptide repeat-containing protein [Clostridia bacterium]|jgi:uncharacterized protein YjbI with pentapeptide repeats|nr:pentapeptide repeat-containing protein [Clostridia bacterium]
MRETKDIIINGKTLEQILTDHSKWLRNENGGILANLKLADLQLADLQDADLQDANLRGADLQDADLQDANLRGADLQGAKLRGAYLQGANLRGAKLDFSCLPLWCGGLNFKIDEKQAKQLMYHVINLMQYSDIDTSKIVKKQIFKWLENSHLVTTHGLPILKAKENE